MTLCLELPVLDFYDRFYQPARHPGDEQRTTREQYHVQIKLLNQFFRTLASRDGELPRDTQLGDLSDELIAGAMNWQVERGRARTTANKLRRTINAVWKYAARLLGKRGLTLARPDNERYREDLAEPIALLPDEFDRVLECCGTRRGRIGAVSAADWWTFYVRLSFNVGGRVSAMRRIPTANLDFARSEVLVPACVQKQRKDQRLGLFPQTLAAGRKLRLAERGVELLLGDYPWQTATLRRHWAQLLVDAGIYTAVQDVPRELKLHALRKTLASMVAAQHGEHAACNVLGHSSVSITRRYIDTRHLQQPSVPQLINDPTGAPDGHRPTLRVVSADAG